MGRPKGDRSSVINSDSNKNEDTMTITKGRIAREGKIVFHDAELRIWEEGIMAARHAGGWAGEQKWEREFKRDVFARIVQTLNGS